MSETQQSRVSSKKSSIVTDRGTFVKGKSTRGTRKTTHSGGTSDTEGSEEDDDEDGTANSWQSAMSELHVANCGRNLVNAQTILTQWKLKNQEYSKVNEVFIFSNLKRVQFCPSGSHLMLHSTEAFMILDKNLNQVANVEELSITDDEGSEITILDLILLNDGKYVVAESYHNRYLLNQVGDVVKISPKLGLRDVAPVSSTAIIGHSMNPDAW